MCDSFVLFTMLKALAPKSPTLQRYYFFSKFATFVLHFYEKYYFSNKNHGHGVGKQRVASIKKTSRIGRFDEYAGDYFTLR